MFKDYQRRATKTFKTHEELNAQQARMLDWALGLCGETGEVVELIKHHIYGKEELNKMELAKELGDILWYLTAMAETTDIELSDLALLNLFKLEHRFNKGNYTSDGSKQRHQREAEFEKTPEYAIAEANILGKTAPMNVIFVGPDGSGKTTIAKDVAELMGFKYHKCSHVEDDKPQLAKDLLQSQINVVYDRFYWPDDVVYSTLKGIEHSPEYWEKFKDVMFLLEEHNTLYIYVDASEEELINRSQNWADDYVTTDMLKQIKKEYSGWLEYLKEENLNIALCMIDTTGIEVDSEEYQLLVHTCCKAIEIGQEIYAGLYIEKGEDHADEE